MGQKGPPGQCSANGLLSPKPPAPTTRSGPILAPIWLPSRKMTTRLMILWCHVTVSADMEPKVLLGELRALADSMPDFEAFRAGSRAHHEWLGKAAALIRIWNEEEGAKVGNAIRDYIGYSHTPYHNSAVSSAVGTVYRAIAHLEIFGVAQQSDHMFGPGAVYDFFKSLSDLMSSATKEIMVPDPYLHDELFDTYLGAVAKTVRVRLLARYRAANLKAAITKFIRQNESNIEARQSDVIHDRVLFVDDRSCWELGQSIKDAAKTRPT